MTKSSALEVYGVNFWTAQISNMISVSRSGIIEIVERNLIYWETTFSRLKAETLREYGHGFCSENSNDKVANFYTLPDPEGILPFKRKNRVTYFIAKRCIVMHGTDGRDGKLDE